MGRPRTVKRCPAVTEIKRRLKREGADDLSVHRGRGTAYGWIEVHRKDFTDLSQKQANAIRKVFNKVPGGNFFCIRESEAEKILGIREKPLRPISRNSASTVKKEPSYIV